MGFSGNCKTDAKRFAHTSSRFSSIIQVSFHDWDAIYLFLSLLIYQLDNSHDS